jgi:hypothetical protein
MQPKREGLESVKTTLAKEQKTRTERRIKDVLQPKPRFQEPEIFDDSEEENRLRGRRLRTHRDKETQTDSSSSSFCCGVIVGWGVFVGFFFAWSYLVECKWQTELGKVKQTTSQEEVLEKKGRLVSGPLRHRDQSQRQRMRLSQSQRQRITTVR